MSRTVNTSSKLRKHWQAKQTKSTLRIEKFLLSNGLPLTRCAPAVSLTLMTKYKMAARSTSLQGKGFRLLRCLVGNLRSRFHCFHPQSKYGSEAAQHESVYGRFHQRPVGVCHSVLKTLTLVQTKYTIFHTLYQTWLSKWIPYFRPCEVR